MYVCMYVCLSEYVILVVRVVRSITRDAIVLKCFGKTAKFASPLEVHLLLKENWSWTVDLP